MAKTPTSTPTSDDTDKPAPGMTVAEMRGALEQATRVVTPIMQAMSGLNNIVANLGSLQQLESEALRRRDDAVAVADTAEQATADKLAVFQQKIDRASQEATRIIEKANADANTTREMAEAQAKEITTPAKEAAVKAKQAENSAKSKLDALTRNIDEAEKTLKGLQDGIAAAQQKIGEFTK